MSGKSQGQGRGRERGRLGREQSAQAGDAAVHAFACGLFRKVQRLTDLAEWQIAEVAQDDGSPIDLGEAGEGLVNGRGTGLPERLAGVR